MCNNLIINWTTKETKKQTLLITYFSLPNKHNPSVYFEFMFERWKYCNKIWINKLNKLVEVYLSWKVVACWWYYLTTYLLNFMNSYIKPHEKSMFKFKYQTINTKIRRILNIFSSQIFIQIPKLKSNFKLNLQQVHPREVGHGRQRLIRK